MHPRAAMLALNGSQLYRLPGTWGIAKEIRLHGKVLLFASTQGFWHRTRILMPSQYTQVPWDTLPVPILAVMTEKDAAWICEL